MLYLVATPIGNLDDISYRQAKILSSSDYILAEDTRSYAILRQGIQERFHFQFIKKQTVISYYKEKEFEKLPFVIQLLNEGKTVSLVSESGMPVVSDPGQLLVRISIKKHIPFIIIPGPSSVDTAFGYSGFKTNQFMFAGFLSKKENEIKKQIEIWKQIKQVETKLAIIFFESPLRIQNTLKLLQDYFPESEICICREMTKKFEEIIRAKTKDILIENQKGEFTIVLY
jgi:16S rRNA (cytidine1402-2'-O)-methyltransferase